MFLKDLAVRARDQFEGARSQREGLRIFWRSEANPALHGSQEVAGSALIAVIRAAEFDGHGMPIPVPLQWSLRDLPDDATLFYIASAEAMMGWSILVPSVTRWPVCEVGADMVALVPHTAFISMRIVNERSHQQLRANLVNAMLAHVSVTDTAADILMWCPASDSPLADCIRAAGFREILQIRRPVPWGALRVLPSDTSTVGRLGLHFVAESRP